MAHAGLRRRGFKNDAVAAFAGRDRPQRLPASSTNCAIFRLSLAVTLTVPAVMAGVALALLLTGTTLNIQSFMGSIMAIGVAVANSILLVTFAERPRTEGVPVVQAALDGASGRLRPILMTSCAMIAGMVPMAVGMAKAASTAPLGRAVIGGLLGQSQINLLAALGILDDRSMLPAMAALAPAS